MAYFDTTWYVNFGDGSTTGHFAVTKRPQNTAVAAGALRRQFTAPTAGNERVFACVVAGTTANTTDASWSLTRGAKTTDGTATWIEVTGMAAVNGDLANTPSWDAVKGQAITQGVIVKRNNAASYQICTTAGTAGTGTEPSFSDVAGTTTVDGGVTWTSLGPAGNFAGGGAPHARLSAALITNWFFSGNTVFVGDNNAETAAASFSSVPISTAIGKVLCHNHSGSYPPAVGDLTTGATIATTSTWSWNLVGSFYFNGITFSTTVALTIFSSTQSNPNWLSFENCSFWCQSLSLGDPSSGTWSNFVFNNVTMKFTATNSGVVLEYTRLLWKNTAPLLVSGSVVPTSLLYSFSPGRTNLAVLEGLDLSQIANIWTPVTYQVNGGLVVRDCKLNAAATVATPLATGMVVDLIRCDAVAPYMSSRYAYEGTETTETSITRSGGAVVDGQAQSRKVATTANVEWVRPYKAEPYLAWNGTVGSPVKATVRGVALGALPLNDELWLELEYLGANLSTRGNIAGGSKANLLAAATAVASDTATWNNVPSGGDLYWPNVKLLMGFNGTNGATSGPGMTDESPAARGAATVAGAQISTAQSKFGGSSLVLSGFQYLTFADSPDWDFGTGPFTIEGLFRFIGNPTSAVLVAQWSGGWAFYFETGALKFRSGSVVDVTPYSWAPTLNQWYAIAVDRDASSVARIYVDGAMVSKSSGYTPNLTGSASVLAIGSLTPGGFGGFDLNGYVDELRITTGVARYASDAGYTVATAAFPRGSPWTPFKLETTVRPWMAGHVQARMRAAKPSAIYYLDPRLELASGSLPDSPATLLTGLIGWWDASVTASMSLTGAEIDSIADQSGAGHGLAKWSTGQSPDYSATGLNSLPSMVFDPAAHDRLIEATALTTGFPIGTGSTLTIFAVAIMTANSPAGDARLLSYTSNPGVGGSGGAGQHDYDADGSFCFSRNGSNPGFQLIRNFASVRQSMSYDVPHRIIGTINSVGLMTLYVDGVAGPLVAGPAAPWVSGGHLIVGGAWHAANINSVWDRGISEVGIATGYADPATVARLDECLRSKWGL